jgi:hypothetical protein
VSTICKIDPRVRKARTFRRELVNAPIPATIRPLRRVAYAAVKADLWRVKNTSWWAGWEKDIVFRILALQLRALEQGQHV